MIKSELIRISGRALRNLRMMLLYSSAVWLRFINVRMRFVDVEIVDVYANSLRGKVVRTEDQMDLRKFRNMLITLLKHTAFFDCKVNLFRVDIGDHAFNSLHVHVKKMN